MRSAIEVRERKKERRKEEDFISRRKGVEHNVFIYIASNEEGEWRQTIIVCGRLSLFGTFG
jgi:hypothetical protein